MATLYYPEGFFVTTLSAAINATTTTIPLGAVPSRVTTGYMVIEPGHATKQEVIHFTSVGVSSVTAADDTTDASDASGRGCVGSITQGGVTAHDQGKSVIIAASEKYWKRFYDKLTAADSDGIQLIEINDTNGNELIKFVATGSAVNEITVTNGATGNPPDVAATGSDTNIDLKLTPKGTGAIRVPSGAYETNVTDDDDIPNKKYVDDRTSSNGWTQYSAVTPTRASADDPTYVLTFAGVDLTSTLYVGMKVKLTQSTDKFFIITKISFSTNTTLTLFGGTDYDVADTGVTAISAFYYSSVQSPAAFPMSPAKWSHVLTSTASDSQASPTDTTWYNLGSRSIDIPIGVWNVEYQVNINGFKSGGAVIVDLWSTLSTANNSESDKDFSTNVLHRAPSGTPVEAVAGQVSRQKLLDLSSKTTYYLNAKSVSSSLGSITFPNNTATMFVRAVCAYL